MKDIIIIGAGGFGREVKCLIESINLTKKAKQFNILGFVDDGVKKGTNIQDLTVLGSIDDLSKVSKDTNLVFGIGDPLIKERLFNKLKGFSFPSIIHPSISLNGFNVKIGMGCIICEQTILTCDIVISDFVTLNLACTVGHDAVIGSFSSIMPSVNVSGEVKIKENVFIGTGVKIINQKTIGKNVIIGAGAVVTKDIPDNCTAVGAPAKPIKFH